MLNLLAGLQVQFCFFLSKFLGFPNFCCLEKTATTWWFDAWWPWSQCDEHVFERVLECGIFSIYAIYICILYVYNIFISTPTQGQKQVEIHEKNMDMTIITGYITRFKSIWRAIWSPQILIDCCLGFSKLVGFPHSTYHFGVTSCDIFICHACWLCLVLLFMPAFAFSLTAVLVVNTKNPRINPYSPVPVTSTFNDTPGGGMFFFGAIHSPFSFLKQPSHLQILSRSRSPVSHPSRRRSKLGRCLQGKEPLAPWEEGNPFQSARQGSCPGGFVSGDDEEDEDQWCPWWKNEKQQDEGEDKSNSDLSKF